MSARLLTKEAVIEKIRQMTKDGNPPSHRTLLGALGCGSMSTLVKILREIEGDEKLRSAPDAEALARFDALWTAAKSAGRQECAHEISALTEALDALTAASEQLEGELDAARAHAAQLAQKRDALFGDVADAQQRLTTTRAAAEEHATKLLTTIEQISLLRDGHTKEISQLTERLRASEAKHEETIAGLTTRIRDLETVLNEKAIELVRFETSLAASSAQLAQETEARAAAVGNLKSAEAQLAEVRLQADALTERLTKSLTVGIEKISLMQTQHAAEIAAIMGSYKPFPQQVDPARKATVPPSESTS